MAVYEYTLSELADCGWAPGLAREAALAIENFVFGSTLMANAPDMAFQPEQRARFPLLAATSEGPPDNPPDDAFELGFAALMAGLKVLVIDRPASERPAPRRRARAAKGDAPRARRRRAN